MDIIYDARNKIDEVYKPIFTKLISALLFFIGSSFILQTGPVSGQLGLIFAVVMAAIFIYSPGGAMFLFCCCFFICLAHINFFFVLIITVLILFFCSCNYVQIALAVLTPACMGATGIFETNCWCVFLLFIYFSTKHEGKAPTIVYSIYFALLMMFTGKFGLGKYIYSNGITWEKSKIKNIDQFFTSIDMEKEFEYFIYNHLANALIVLCIIVALALIIRAIFLNKKIFSRFEAMDIRELVMFAIAMILLIIVNILFLYVLKLNCGAHYLGMVAQVLIAYIVSRPFTSNKVTQTFLTKEQVDGQNETVTIGDAVVPRDSWDDIAGYDNTKREIREAIKPYVDKEEYKLMQQANMKPIKGILLFGPPGTGKTSIARAIANETNMKLIVVNAGEFVNMYIGESEKALRKIFDDAKKDAPALICFDEIESFLAKRNDESKSYEKNIITTFLSQMDGFNELKDVLVVGTTNKPNLIDDAALRPGRFDKIIYVGAPNEAARKALFRKYLNKKANLDYIDIDRLVDNSERYTGADIKGVCEEAYRQNKFSQLTEEDIIDHLKRIRPSYTLDMKDEYYKWSQKFTRSTVSEQDYVQKKKNSLKWDDIKGMGALKDVLKKKIENPIKNVEKYRKYNIPISKGILFFGPPGCGKTFFAKVVADECNTAFFTINGPELFGGKVGESESNLRKVFRSAREAKPAIIFFDEIDAIAGKRDDVSGGVRLVNQLLTEMDGMESLDGVIVIAATNRPDTIDPALMRAGRFDTKIYIGMPDEEARRDMLCAALKEIPNTLDFNLCAAMLENYSCADITGVANKVKEHFIQRSIIEDAELPITDDDFKTIIRTVRPSITATDLAKYERMKALESIL